METKNYEQPNKKKAKKHKLSDSESEIKTENGKKARVFSITDLRNGIKSAKTEEKLFALQDFLEAIQSKISGSETVYQFLVNGGSCLEFLQVLELDSTVSPVLIFEIIYEILLKINANFSARFESVAIDCAQYLLKNYTAVINKMLNLSSTSVERRVALRLLTVLVTLSAPVAKDVLLNVNFHQTNLELLTKHTGEKDSVRDVFVHFLTGFLVVEGHFPALSVLLDKKGLITSIVPGLLYDNADTVCMVLRAMENYILKNQFVSKTTKMKTFNTLVVKDIVNLYNWKGPAGFKALKKGKTASGGASVPVDEYEKSKVNECVHDFLLVLCTSHRHGVIFRDPQVGLGKRNHNSLMYTVLQSLERPWEHSYASQLIVRICGACPDLTKSLWTILTPFLEPRWTAKWLTAVKFARNLIAHLQPSCIEFAVKDLSANQLGQLLTILVAPLPVLKTINQISEHNDRPAVKKVIVRLILDMLNALDAHLSALRIPHLRKVKSYLSNYIARNFPPSQSLLSDWNAVNNDADAQSMCADLDIDISDNYRHLSTVFEVLVRYRQLSEQMLDSTDFGAFDLRELICQIGYNARHLQATVVGIFLDFDATKFHPSTDLFAFVFKLLTEHYFDSRSAHSLTVLHKLLSKGTCIFDGCDNEINIWLNGILNLPTTVKDNDFLDSLIEILRMTNENFIKYIKVLGELNEGADSRADDVKDVLENLAHFHDTYTYKLKTKYLSPLIVGLMDFFYLRQGTSDLFDSYLEFVLPNLLHLQSSGTVFQNLVKRYKFIPKYFVKYVDWFTKNCPEGKVFKFKPGEGLGGLIQTFGKAYFDNQLEQFLEDLEKLVKEGREEMEVDDSTSDPNNKKPSLDNEDSELGIENPELESEDPKTSSRKNDYSNSEHSSSKNRGQNNSSNLESANKSFPNFESKFQKFQTFFNSPEFRNSRRFYPDFKLDLLQQIIFYFSLNDTFLESTSNFVKLVLTEANPKFWEVVLENRSLVDSFSPHLESSIPITKFILEIVKFLAPSRKVSNDKLLNLLQPFQKKFLQSIMKILKKPHKYVSNDNVRSMFLLVLNDFPLESRDCDFFLEILTFFLVHLQNSKRKSSLESSQLVFEIIVHCFRKITLKCQEKSPESLEDLDNPIEDRLLTNLNPYILHLVDSGLETKLYQLSRVVKDYLEKFPKQIPVISSEIFEKLLSISFHKENVSLAVFLLSRNRSLVDHLNLDQICENKAIILPVLQILVQDNHSEELLERVYQKIESSIDKALTKPQKAGQNFVNFFEGIPHLISKFMAEKTCQKYLDKVQKFEVTETFHARILEAIVRKLSVNLSEKQVNNAILIFIHLEMNLLKKLNAKLNPEDELKVKETSEVLSKVSESFAKVLHSFTEVPKILNYNLKSVSGNETFKLFSKFCLKFGVGGEKSLLYILASLIKILHKCMDSNEAKLLLDLLVSHSEFLDRLLARDNNVKDIKVSDDLGEGILSLFKVLCENWPELMERSHIPVLLSAYKALVTKFDRTILDLLKMYESNAGQTNFYDFKPFLWDKPAAIHYSVRHNIESNLRRQPKMADVLDILQEPIVLSTITNYPFHDKLFELSTLSENPSAPCYDLSFLLPLFSQLLAPENEVQTYKFTKSGALSLTIVALSSNCKEVRQAACHVLARFYNHLEARHAGKDNLLWIRFVEAVCKGTALLPNFKLNNFSAIYLARMALILTQPNHVMYLPLSQHLTAKEQLDFSTVPELYTLLHSSDVNFREHRLFILELLRDGLRCDKDFVDFERSMAFKLISEQFNSSVSDSETRLLILDVVSAACRLYGVKVLCENHSLLVQLQLIVDDLSRSSNDFSAALFGKVIDILHSVAKFFKGRNQVYSHLISGMVQCVAAHESFAQLKAQNAVKVADIAQLIGQNIC